MFFAAERNAINVEIQAFRNLTYNATLRARGSSIESKNKFYPPVLPLVQQIVFDHPTVKYLPFARSGLLPPNTIVPRKLVLPRSENSSESIHAESPWYEHVRSLVLPTQRTQVSSQRRQRLKCGGRPVSDTGFRPWNFRPSFTMCQLEAQEIRSFTRLVVLSEINEAYKYCHAANTLIFTKRKRYKREENKFFI